MNELDLFRSETREWLEKNCPAEMRGKFDKQSDNDGICWGGRNFEFYCEEQRDWLNVMASRGWTVPAWPKAYGGGGLSGEQQKILAEELKHIDARPPLQSFGISMLGPALLEYGTEAQKTHFLTQIAKGEIRWCQGYSEPDAGSDLASVQTKGVDDGENFVVSGQKVWTSYADKADWIFCLVRTEPDARQHKGISFLLFDMASEGVSTKPIKLISGDSPFCETFFDEVKVPKNQIIGERGAGWTIAKYLLTHEREMIGSSDLLFSGLDICAHAASTMAVDEKGNLLDGLTRAEIGSFIVDEMAFNAHMDMTKAYMRAGNQLGARSAELKYVGTELNKSRQSLLMSIDGANALVWAGTANHNSVQASEWLRSKANSIEGGTSEIMLSILSKAILRMPS
ncbi:MAG: acyl-CoA dehydrogenase family protein [Hyphomicrobiales bacterium]